MAARTARLARSAYISISMNAAKSGGCSTLHHTGPFLPRSAELSGATIASNGISSVVYSTTGVTDGVADNVVKPVKSLNGKGSLRLFHSSTPLYSAAASSSQVVGSLHHHRMTYSTNVTDDPDTHEDFRPISKHVSSGLSKDAIVEQDVRENPVMIYMKGVPDLPQCGFSSLAVRILKTYGVPFSARNILEDPELKNAVKAFSNWPTFPQIFIKGEFVGGSDIILNMHQNGELEEKLKDIDGKQESKE